MNFGTLFKTKKKINDHVLSIAIFCAVCDSKE